MRIVRSAAVFVLAMGAAVSAPPAVEAGPPCICWPIQIGSARSLPWGTDAMTTRDDYDLSRLVPDTLAILDETASPMVRMETCRRAAIYLMQRERSDSRRAWELYGRLAARALDDEAAGRGNPLPWFDVAYLVEAFEQAGVGEHFPNGEAWIETYLSRAAARPGGEAAAREMAFGAALMTYMGQDKPWRRHALRAAEGTPEDSLLAKNLVTLFGKPGDTLEALRSRLASPPKADRNH